MSIQKDDGSMRVSYEEYRGMEAFDPTGGRSEEEIEAMRNGIIAYEHAFAKELGHELTSFENGPLDFQWTAQCKKCEFSVTLNNLGKVMEKGDFTCTGNDS